MKNRKKITTIIFTCWFAGIVLLADAGKATNLPDPTQVCNKLYFATTKEQLFGQQPSMKSLLKKLKTVASQNNRAYDWQEKAFAGQCQLKLNIRSKAQKDLPTLPDDLKNIFVTLDNTKESRWKDGWLLCNLQVKNIKQPMFDLEIAAKMNNPERALEPTRCTDGKVVEETKATKQPKMQKQKVANTTPATEEPSTRPRRSFCIKDCDNEYNNCLSNCPKGRSASYQKVKCKQECDKAKDACRTKCPIS